MFYNVIRACVPHHMCFYVSAVVAAWLNGLLTPFDVPVISCVRVAFWQDHTVKHVPRAKEPK